MATCTWVGGASGDTTNWNNSGNWSTSGAPTRVPTTADDVIIPNVTHDPTIPDGLNPTVLSIEVQSSAQLTCGNNTITCTNESTDYAFSVSGTLVPNTSTVVISNIGSDTYIKVDNGTLHNLTINSSGDEVKAASNLTLGGNLTITAGELDILTRDLTVTGNIDVDGGNLTINDSAVSCAKLIVESGDTITAAHSSNALTVTGAGIGNNRSIDFTGAISGTLDIITTHSGTREDDLSASSGIVNHLTVNHADAVMRMNAAYTVGSLTITAGQFSTADAGGSSKALTVTGEVNVAGTLTCNSSACSFGSLDSTGLTNLADSSGSTLITNENSDGLSIVAGTYSTCVPAKIKHNNGTVTFNNHSDPAAHAAIVCGNSNATDGLYNVIIDGANTVVDTYDPGGSGQECKIHNNFTVTNGSFQVNGASNPFDVGGDVLVSAGKMFGDAAAPTGAMSFGSLTIESGATFRATSGTTTITSENGSGFAINHDGTFTHNNGTVTVTTADTTKMDLNGTGNLYNLIINSSGHINQWDGNTTIDNDLTITAGTFQQYGFSDTLTVTGDVSVTGVLGHTSGTGAISMKSLTINSGGTYKSPANGTTTITGGGADGDANTSFYRHTAGTFTHNNGTLVFDGCQYRIIAGGTFYNVTVQGEIVGNGVYNYAGSPLPVPTMPDGTSAVNTIAILGTLHIKNDEWRPYGTNKMYIHNLIIGDGTGSSNTATFDMSEDDNFDGTVWVDNVTINSDGRLLFGDGDETSATAGSSALNIYGAFRNLGGSVDIT